MELEKAPRCTSLLLRRCIMERLAAPRGRALVGNGQLLGSHVLHFACGGGARLRPDPDVGDP
eukprot:729227-Pyramimonas_sp.AAC.2